MSIIKKRCTLEISDTSLCFFYRYGPQTGHLYVPDWMSFVVTKVDTSSGGYKYNSARPLAIFDGALPLEAASISLAAYRSDIV